MDGPRSWAIITGEYPPQPGGVSDYTHLLARGLAAAGDSVRVYGPPGGDPADAGVSVERLPDAFGPRGLWALHRSLRRLDPATVVLVQYVPHAFGWKAMNVPFCLWLASLRRPVWVMFHEVAFPCHAGQSWKHRFLGAVTQRMARIVSRTAQRTFLSTQIWEKVLHDLGGRPRNAVWLPVPSNIPVTGDPADCSQRSRVAPRGTEQVVGHFGTFAPVIADRLIEPLRHLLRDEARIGLMIGLNSDRFVERLIEIEPTLAGRVLATGGLEANEVSGWLRACDVLVQPYPDGISTRRGSAMAGLALGVPLVTNDGIGTESVWREGGVALCPPSAEGLIATTQRLLADAPARNLLGKNGQELYQNRFSLERTLEVLRSRGC